MLLLNATVEKNPRRDFFNACATVRDRLAFRRPYFLRSTFRGSRFIKPRDFNLERQVGFKATRARDKPSRMASAWELKPPPPTNAVAWYSLSESSPKGARTVFCNFAVGKYSEKGKSFTIISGVLLAACDGKKPDAGDRGLPATDSLDIFILFLFNFLRRMGGCFRRHFIFSIMRFFKPFRIQAVFGQHQAHGVPENPGRILFENIGEFPLLEMSQGAGVLIINLLIGLLAGNGDLRSVRDQYPVGIHKPRIIIRALLTLEQKAISEESRPNFLFFASI